VVTSRNHVRYVVTEYGVADLYGKSIRQRAQQLINIANPDFRLNLERQSKELHYL
jgi:acetyl-CoA hydrolase